MAAKSWEIPSVGTPTKRLNPVGTKREWSHLCKMWEPRTLSISRTSTVYYRDDSTSLYFHDKSLSFHCVYLVSFPWTSTTKFTTYIRDHRQVEGSGHARLCDAGLLRADVGSHVLRPQVGCARDTGQFLAASLGYHKLQSVSARAHRPCVQFRHSQRDGSGYTKAGAHILLVPRPPLGPCQVPEREDIATRQRED